MKINLRAPKTWGTILSLPLLAFFLAWASSGFNAVNGWVSFLILLALSASAIAGLFILLRHEQAPGWLVGLTIGAALLRLAAGAAWFILLPTAGYDTDVQSAGYVMEDAFQRDNAAWELASSDAPLWGAFRETAFGNLRAADQYGGLLFISAAVYRYLGTDVHQPLLLVVLSAVISAMLVPLGWALARRLFGEKTARWSAWGLALFPEAVLLGSSQMREAWVMPAAAASMYGLIRYQTGAENEKRAALAWMVVPLLLLLPISPPLAAFILGLMVLVGLGLDHWRLFRSWRLWLVLGVFTVLVVGVVSLGWEQIAPRLNADEYASPLEMARSWFELSARWQARQTEDASGWLQKVFESTPEWTNLPFLILYGISRPLLPAQLVAYSVPIWWGIGVWRALGWTLLLLPLLLAPIQLLRTKDRQAAVSGLAAAVWIGIVAASFWGGGDQWDNPRYRVAFVVLQVVLAAHVLITNRESPDPWLRRAAIIGLTTAFWFIPWYLRRYTAFNQVFGWSVVDLFKLLGAGVFTGVLLAVRDWVKE